MDERKQRVLAAIVSLYAADGEPVGSSLLQRHIDMAVSTATLRNEMAALTRLGLLEQPHTSAGRVPSIAGYRYYIENLMGRGQGLTARQRSQVDAAFEGFDYDPERLAKAAAAALAGFTGFTCISTTPKSEDMKIAYYSVLQSGRYSAAVLCVNSAGGVATRVAVTQRPIQPKALAAAAALINRRLCFVAKDDAGEGLREELQAALDGDDGLWPVAAAALRLLEGAGRGRVFVEGEQNLLSWPQLEPSLRSCLELLGRPEELQQLIAPPGDRPMVLLGDELPGWQLPGAALVSRRYLAGGGRTGAIALLGPARMDYERVIPILEYFAAKLGRAMTYAGKEE